MDLVDVEQPLLVEPQLVGCRLEQPLLVEPVVVEPQLERRRLGQPQLVEPQLVRIDLVVRVRWLTGRRHAVPSA